MTDLRIYSGLKNNRERSFFLFLVMEYCTVIPLFLAILKKYKYFILAASILCMAKSIRSGLFTHLKYSLESSQSTLASSRASIIHSLLSFADVNFKIKSAIFKINNPPLLFYKDNQRGPFNTLQIIFL